MSHFFFEFFKLATGAYHTTIQQEGCAVNVGCFVAAEEQNGSSDIFRGADTALGNAFDGPLGLIGVAKHVLYQVVPLMHTIVTKLRMIASLDNEFFNLTYSYMGI